MQEKLSPHNPFPSPKFTLQHVLAAFSFLFPAQTSDKNWNHRETDNKVGNSLVGSSGTYWQPAVCCQSSSGLLSGAAHCGYLGSFKSWYKPGAHPESLMWLTWGVAQASGLQEAPLQVHLMCSQVEEPCLDTQWWTNIPGVRGGMGWTRMCPIWALY